MCGCEIITKYFPGLAGVRLERFEQLQSLYSYWNERINVVSRKDIEHLYTRHVLHSLAIAKIFTFAPEAEILDVGTGGGFPVVPLAIMFPETHFTAIDSIGKKIKALENISKSLGLTNIVAKQERAENICEKFDFVTGRAVTNLPDFVGWVRKNIKHSEIHAVPNGIICLKGGDLNEEIQETVKKYSLSPEQVNEYQISDFFEESFFETKKIVYLKINHIRNGLCDNLQVTHS
ncbi:MAG: 16S rRNA (guanine(527)-N(7))-methyltransferase RsmG [Prevotellaceae bacterium]|jgi:16S rRNA (guanine527-N7)-methyltransferase|nr:16S rRNA (guanine(527)-N(7))-methyltransferase RsmG [Prevotellaceae bacterium]